MRVHGAFAILAAMALAPAAHAVTVPPVVRGARAVLLQVEPGPLSIRLLKRDLNIYEGEDTLTAQLFDPQRRRVAAIELPDDGNAGKGGRAEGLQSGEINVTCEAPGVYRLAVTGGSDQTFGLEASCERCVLEGEVMLNDDAVSGEVVFRPPGGAFSVTAQAIHAPGRQKLPVLDAGGVAVHTFDLTEPGQDLVHEVPEGAGARDGLWRFAIEHMDVKMQVAGVTHWAIGEASYFDVEKTRWMLLPYSATRYLEPGASAEIDYTLRNRTGRPAEFGLVVRSEPRMDCRLVASETPVKLAKGEQRNVRVAVRVPGDAKIGDVLTGHLTATAVDDSTVTHSVGIEVRVGPSPVSLPLSVPIVHQRYRHENALYGYAPDYVRNEVYFDRRNRPFIRQRTEDLYLTTAITLLEDGRWVERPFVPVLEKAFPGFRGTHNGAGFLGAKIAFDGDDDAYTLVRARYGEKSSVCALLFTPDDGRTYSIHKLPGQSFDIEQFTGHNALDHPPPVLAYRKNAEHPARFAGVNDLLIYLPTKRGEELTLGEPALVSASCLGSCQHSGGPASTATRDGRTHIVWGEVTEEDVPGVPSYVASYDHATGRVGDAVFLAYAPPINDVHNVPAVCLDSEGYLHVVIGAHGEPFKHTRSLKPNDAYSGWTEPVEVLSAGYVDDTTDEDGRGRQTYISLVCDPSDTLHIAFRQWRRNVDEHHPGQNYAALSVQSKPKGKPWGPARPLVIPPVSGYSIFYHKLTIDRLGRLFLSYNHWTSDLTYQNEFPDRYHHRAVLVSKDAGQTWKLAETSDFLGGLL
jgi:hypothetical protein